MRHKVTVDLVAWAEAEAQRRLAPLGARWLHSTGVAARAREITSVVDPADCDLLIAAAVLHDVGYAPELAISGFHPLDGARWLRGHGHHRLANLVAHHTGASFEAAALGLEEAVDEFVDEQSAVTDALAYCDLTTGPVGERISVRGRLDEIEKRYGATSIVARALQSASEALFAMVARTEFRLSCAIDQQLAVGRSRDV
jgi:HD superfamily phosphodiesterase